MVISKYVKPTIFLAFVFVICFLSRVLFSQVPINIDENLWFFRGSGFVAQILSRDVAKFQETYYQHHPGVPTMWINGFGITLGCAVDNWFPPRLTLNPESVTSCIYLLREQNFVPIESYVFTRVIQGVITSALMTLSSFLMFRLVNLKVAITWIAILALEPFFLAYQRLLITDSLQCGFILVSVLALFLHWRLASGKSYLILSGVAMGMAIATKTTTILLFPGLIAIAILTELNYFQAIFPKKGIAEQAKDIGIWTLCLMAIFILIWPAMWVAPWQTLSSLVEDLRQETQRGDLFFLGQTRDRLNALFYPIVIPYRLSPLLLLSGFTSVLLASLPSWKPNVVYQKYLVANFILIFSFLWMISLPGNKFDRYILPIVPVLAINAAIASFIILKRLKHYLNHSDRQRLSKIAQTPGLSFNISILVILGIQVITVYPFVPYYISYYNPLLGGTRAAKYVLMRGQGEGLDLVGDWLNRQANPEDLVVITQVLYRPALAPYFKGEVLAGGISWTEGLLQKAHFLILYVKQIHGHIPTPEVVDYFTRQDPVHVVQLNGVDYASIYLAGIARPEEMQNLITPQETIESEGLQLRGYTLTSERLTPGDDLELTLYWDILQEIPSQTTFSLSINQGNTSVMVIPRVILEGLLGDDPIEPGKIIRDLQFVSFPVTLPPGDYSIGISLSSPVSSSEEALVDVATDIPRTLGLFEMLPSED
ncbi:glycosyltransferase family 39 protein [Geitlerinema sp. P-1104]|uniref:ArnT family glycosyltransferase n=1 Tax=Geitlerinema sp. P-1104 TaxID=2546230 RepID=UPI001476CA71|nr:glycosyltransferase family 39 protein [Geitlerinema sp. P-1104]